MHHPQLEILDFFNIDSVFPCCGAKEGSRGCNKVPHSPEEDFESFWLDRCTVCFRLYAFGDPALATASDVEALYLFPFRDVCSTFREWSMHSDGLKRGSFLDIFPAFNFLRESEEYQGGLNEMGEVNGPAADFGDVVGDSLEVVIHPGSTTHAVAESDTKSIHDVEGDFDTATRLAIFLCRKVVAAFPSFLSDHCYTHPVSFKEQNVRASRGVTLKYGNTNIPMAGLSTAAHAAAEKKHIILVGKIEVFGKSYKVDMGQVLNIPTNRYKKFPNGSYEIEAISHVAYQFNPWRILADTVTESRAKLSLLAGGAVVYKRQSIEILRQGLQRCGYPADCPDVIKPLNLMNKEELANALFKAHSTFNVAVWGDHGPIDGRSHLLFLQNTRFYPFQFEESNDATKAAIYNVLEHTVRPVLVCRMGNEQHLTLAAMRKVGDLYKDRLMQNVALEGKVVSGVFRWAKGDLSFLASVAMVQKGGNGANSFGFPFSALRKKDYTNYPLYVYTIR